MKSIYLKSFSFLIGMFVSLGCGVIGYHEKIVHDSAQYIAETREKYEKQYIGKPTEIIINDFGKPYFVRENIYTSGEIYDAEWSYRIYKGSGILKTAHTLWFYIKDDAVGSVSVW
jgi:hypothetical protein